MNKKSLFSFFLVLTISVIHQKLYSLDDFDVDTPEPRHTDETRFIPKPIRLSEESRIHQTKPKADTDTRTRHNQAYEPIKPQPYKSFHAKPEEREAAPLAKDDIKRHFREIENITLPDTFMYDPKIEHSSPRTDPTNVKNFIDTLKNKKTVDVKLLKAMSLPDFKELARSMKDTDQINLIIKALKKEGSSFINKITFQSKKWYGKLNVFINNLPEFQTNTHEATEDQLSILHTLTTSPEGKDELQLMLNKIQLNPSLVKILMNHNNIFRLNYNRKLYNQMR